MYTGNNVDQGRFTRAVRADKPQNLAGVHIKAVPRECRQSPEVTAYVFELQNGRHRTTFFNKFYIPAGWIRFWLHNSLRWEAVVSMDPHKQPAFSAQ